MNKFLLLLLFTTSYFYSSAQKIECGGLAGMINYYGDLQPRRLTLKNPKFAYGAFLQYNYNEKWSLRLNGLVSALDGADADYPDRLRRGYSFESNLRQLTTAIEWFPFGKKERDAEDYLQKNHALYLSAGGGLALVHTRTQGLPENSLDLKRGSYEIPVIIQAGIGYKWDLNQFTNMGIEYIFHTSTSDYLDGISEAGNPDVRDWYNYIGLSVSYVLRTNKKIEKKMKEAEEEKN